MKTIKFSLLLVTAFCLTSMSSFAIENHMDKALEHLREAKVQLEKAVYPTPAQKEKAIQLIDAAIRHVEAMKG